MSFIVINAGSGNSTVSSASLTVPVLATSGNMLVVMVGSDNDGASGTSSVTSVTDPSGNTYVNRASNTRTAGVANDGVSLNIFTSSINVDFSGNVSVNFSPNTVRKTAVIYRAIPFFGSSVLFGTAGSGLTGNGSTPSVSGYVINGRTIFGGLAVETDDAITDDSDTESGVWSAGYSSVADGGPDISSIKLHAQYKTVSDSGIQTFNPTYLFSRDYAINYVTLYSPEDEIVPESYEVNPEINSDCPSCSRDCISNQFCPDSLTVSLPKNLLVKVIANPDFWGFGTEEENVLISGWATFNNGHYDFFDGFDEFHFANRTCDGITIGPLINEQRPDVMYRSVYDPESATAGADGKMHYDGTGDDIERGGAEVYLVDRPKGQLAGVTSDNQSCDTTNPAMVYKKVPENFGFGNKIIYSDKIFKNITGAWRLISLDNCYSDLFESPHVALECDGTSKQSINREVHFGEEYDPFRFRTSGDYPDCLPDGALASPYSGEFKESDSLIRDTGVSYFIQANLTYKGAQASALREGGLVQFAIEGSGEEYANQYIIHDIRHSGSFSSAKLVGTFGTDNISYNIPSGSWTMLRSIDPESCCSESAYGVDNDTKWLLNDKNYHADFGRSFNNAKNIRQSNRLIGNRRNYGLDITQVGDGARLDTTYPSFTSTGISLDDNFPVFENRKPYYGPFYEVDRFDTATRRNEKQNITVGQNATCFSKKASLEVFPDCATQYFSYPECETETIRWLTNQISRLGFVYRGCDYPDKCEFNSSGHPLAGWVNGAPTGINDLKRGLAGQEVYMFINLDEVLGTKIEDPPCACEGDVPPGQDPPSFVEIPSPVTFPSFPKFDLYPELYGCRDPLFQMEYATGCESSGLPSSGSCDMPTSAYACNVRQPYTTYGFMRNLCGGVDSDRREVIVNAFANLIQNGNYTNLTATSGQNEPMYWEFNNPYTHESGITGYLSPSGSRAFWGLADSTGRLVAPYFRTKTGENTLKCGDPVNYLDFDLCATRANGWPTNSVPFLITIDHSDACTSCVTPMMEGNLTLTLESLNTNYSHGPNNSEKYGFNHCRYKGVAVDPTYHCNSGFSTVCNGSGNTGNTLQHNEPYTGETCGCINTDISLRKFTLKDTDKIIGWSTWTNNNSFVKLPSGCNQNYQNDFLQESLFNPVYGFSVYGSFRLACDGMHKYLDVFDSGGRFNWSSLDSPLSTLYQGGSCSLHYPSAGSDLTLKSSFLVISSGMEQLFELLPESFLSSDSYLPISDLSDITVAPSTVAEMLFTGNVVGCPSYLIEYGCAGTDSSGNAAFYNCSPCPPTTPACECDGVVCDSCSGIIEVDGAPDNQLPPRYRTPCGCDCDLQPMRIWKYENNTKSLHVSFESGVCSGDPIAIQVSGTRGTTGIINTYFDGAGVFGYGPQHATASTICSWHSGPNSTINGIDYEFQIPQRLAQGEATCSSLNVGTCEETSCSGDSNVGRGACGDPIPWTGVVPDSGVSVIRRACYPEVMIVDKIECVASGFKLSVAREYHTHARNWEEIVLVGSPPAPVCVPVQKGAYRYTQNSTDYCVAIPFATPTDSVTPAYNTEEVLDDSGNIISYRSICLSHPSSGTFAHQDFLYGPNPIASGEDTVWNYYNLFYTLGFPSSKYHNAIYLGDADGSPPEDACADGVAVTEESIFGSGAYLIPTGRYGVDATNRKHSCLQDYTQCGGEFFCNKMFFPRRSYDVGTRVTRFGALQYCRSHYELKVADWYSGYDDFDSETEIQTETKNSRSINPCESGQYTLTTQSMGIDEVSIVVEDYLPLIGIKDTNFRYTSDIKSCIVLGDSCSSSWIPIHTSGSLSAGLYLYKTLAEDGETSFGYYLDKEYTSVQDSCLFTQFKILVDVECCTSNIRTTNYPKADPTMLEYVIEQVPSWACGGFIKPPACTCDTSICGGIVGYYDSAPKPTCLTLIRTRGTYSEVASTGMIDYYEGADCTGESPCPPTSGYTTRPGVRVTIGDSLFIYNMDPEAGLEVELGVPGLENVVGCNCYDGSNFHYWGRELGAYSVYNCDGDRVLASGSDVVNLPAYECGDYYYIKADDFGGIIEGCCNYETLCDTLERSWKIPKNGCFIGRTSNFGNHQADFYNCQDCHAVSSYQPCSDSVIKATFTEE